MVEPVSITMAAVSLAGLFNNIVSSFEYVQFGRNFSADFGRSQLKLDIARLRLSRWGEAVGLSDEAQLESLRLEPEKVPRAEGLLGSIDETFRAAANVSSKLGAVEGNPLDPTALNGQAASSHQCMRSICSRRQGQTGLRQKVKWALHERKHLNDLITDVTGFIENLEDLFPPIARDVVERLRESEATELDASGGVSLLRTVTAEVDKRLDNALSKTAESKGNATFNNYGQVGNQAHSQVFNTPQHINVGGKPW